MSIYVDVVYQIISNTNAIISQWHPQLMEVGGKGGLGDGSLPAGSTAVVGVWGQSPYKRKQYANLKGKKPSLIAPMTLFGVYTQ